MQLLRCLRLDDSDDSLYPVVAEAGEWVVPGTFVFTFSQRSPEALEEGERAAFRTGMLAVGSFGWTTLAVVAAIGETERRQLLEHLARHFVDHYGAPGVAEAMDEARREVEFSAQLAEPAVGTIVSVERHLTDEGVAEDFRVHRPRDADWQAGQPIRVVPESTS